MKRLNLGCDRDYREGWINLDCHRNLKADVIHDLNKFPWPFKDNEFDFVLACHVLEHLYDIPKVMKEIHRITKKYGIIEIYVPYFNSFNAFRDCTHVRFFTWDTLSPFCGFVSSREAKSVGYLPSLFSYKKRELCWAFSSKKLGKIICSIMNSIINLNPEFMERRFPWLITSEALHVILKVNK